MPTAEELLEQSLELVEEPVPMLRISNDLRTIDIPEEVSIIGVENDDDVLRLHFEMPQHYGEFDLSEFLLRVNFINAQKEGDIYRVADATTRDGHIYFSWLVGRTATRYKGDTTFIVCARKISADGLVEKEFNTTIASLKVLEGLETHDQVIQENPDVIELLLRKMSSLEASGVYYTPYVDDYGNLYWNPSAEGLPAVPVVNIKGSGVPAGGSEGQTLVKRSDEDGDAEWADMDLTDTTYTDAENEGVDEEGNILIVNADKLGGKEPSEYLQKSQVVNNFTTTQEGFVADARSVKMLNDDLGFRLKYARITYETMSFAPGSQSFIPTTIPEGAPESGTVIAVVLYSQYDNVFYQWNPQLLSGIRDVNTYSFAVNNLRGASFSTNVRGVVLYRD